uniref:Uncharacterized protein n=1 Tax=Arion vulgaris TaxID=1028688 RepID=A0A0B6ZSA4_9EUPU
MVLGALTRSLSHNVFATGKSKLLFGKNMITHRGLAGVKKGLYVDSMFNKLLGSGSVIAFFALLWWARDLPFRHLTPSRYSTGAPEKPQDNV